MARVLVLDVIGDGTFHEAQCNKLDDYYRELRCSCFDIATRNVGGKYFDMFVDDCGLFVDNPIPSVIKVNPADGIETLLVGNVVFANHDSAGNTTSLSDDDIKLIKSNSSVAIFGDKIINVVHADY